MKSSVRAFGIGIFIAGASLAGYEQFSPSSKVTDTEQIESYKQQIADLEKQLDEKSGATSVEKPATQQDDSSKKEPTETKETDSDSNTSSSNEDVVTATVYIYENVSLYAIGQQVEEEGIISNGRELELFLSKPEFSRSIQKGAFDLSSDMTIEQIAKILTGKKID